jgi:hypothetical protein
MYRSNPNYMFFREGIKPAWEDEANMDGGMWRVVLKSEERSKYLDTFWLETLMALVGERFAYSNYITGTVLQRRQKEDRIQIWTRGVEDRELDARVQKQIAEDLKTLLNISSEIVFTRHNDLKKMDEFKRFKGNGNERRSPSGNRRRSCSRQNSRDRSSDKQQQQPVMYKNRSFGMRVEQAGDSYRV